MEVLKDGQRFLRGEDNKVIEHRKEHVINLYHQVTNYANTMANTGGLQYYQMYSTTPAVGDPQLARVDLYTRVVP